MRNLKKFLALVLAMLMVVSAAATVSAFDDVADDHAFAAAINDLTVKEIVNGYDGETFGPDDAVTRQQMAIMMARAITGNVGDNAVWQQGGLVAFGDVTEYQYAIATVVKAGIVNGFLDNTFRPEEGITFVQALKMAVCALGYDDGTLAWWEGYYNVALDLGLTEGLNYITDADKALNRGEVAQLVYNMLYIPLADGSDCFASQNFGLATATNVTTFIITATDEQTAYEGMDVAEGGYVGLQQLVNGVPDGDVVYIPVEMFGFEDDEDEAAFLNAYGIVNWNADKGTFDQIIPTGNSWKIYNAEISSIKNGKFTYDGKNFYPVEELSGTAIRNEVVLYNSTDFGYDYGNKQLFLNAKGEVLGKDGEVVLEAVYSVTGNIVSYLEVSTGKYLSIANATATYGEVIDDIAQSYTIVDTATLTDAYELTVFDDDMDGKMDRAYYTPVYVSVYEGINSSNQHLTEGPLTTGYNDGKFDNDDGKVTGMEDLSKGDVFVYTFNKQLREVTVLEVLEIEEGTVKKIDTTTNKSSTYYSTITLTDGTALKVYDYDQLTKLNAALGANVQKSGTIDYDDKDGWMYQVYDTDYLRLDRIEDDELLEVLEVGDLIRYYSRNGVILFAETYDIDDIYERVVLKDVIDADLEAIYLDVYRNGDVEEIAVTKIWDNGEYVTLADLSWIKISKILSNLVGNDTLVEGNIYKIAELGDGYQMSIALDDDEDDNFADAIDDPSAFGLYAMDMDLIDNMIEIEDGVVKADSIVSDDDATVRSNRLRTNEDTIWYFIEESTGKVRVATGDIEDAEIYVGETTRIYADKLGYKNLTKTVGKTTTTLSNKGVATVVYVINAADGTNGFGWGSADTSIVFMTGMTSKRVDYYTQGDAEEVGLNTKEYTAANYYKYSSSYSIDMYTGASYTVYSTFLLENDTPYTVDENGVVTTKTAPAEVNYTVITRDGIDDENDYIKITDEDGDVILSADACVEALYARNASSSATTTRKGYSAIKSNIMTSTTAEYEIAYLTGFEADDEDEDGIFVMIFNVAEEEEEEEVVAKVSANAKYTAQYKKVGSDDITSNATEYAAVAALTVDGNTISGTAYATTTEFVRYTKVDDVKREFAGALADDAVAQWWIAEETKAVGDAVYSSWKNADVAADVILDEDVFTITLEQADSSLTPNASSWASLKSGTNYKLVIEVAFASGNIGQFIIFFTK